MKGKGRILTYWLRGKQGCKGRVPLMPPALRDQVGIDTDYLEFEADSSLFSHDVGMLFSLETEKEAHEETAI